MFCFRTFTCSSHGEEAVLDVRVRCLPSKFTFPRWRCLTRRLLEKTISLKYGWRVSGAWPPVPPWCFIVDQAGCGCSCFTMFRRILCTRLYAPLTATSVAMSSCFVTAEWALGWRKTSSGLTVLTVFLQLIFTRYVTGKIKILRMSREVYESASFY